MDVIEVSGETVSALSRLVKQAGEQQRHIVIELSKELGRHNLMVERAMEKENKMISRAIRIEQLMMNKEMNLKARLDS